MTDSIYKTNKYSMPLFEIVGVTSTVMTFFAAFVLLASEREKNFVWILERLKWLIFIVDFLFTVFVNDRDVSLMSELKMCFQFF